MRAAVVVLLLAGCTPSTSSKTPKAEPPTLKTAEPCAFDSECISGECFILEFAETGLCAERECLVDEDCAEGSVCSFFGCVGRCLPPAQRKEACFFVSDDLPECQPMTTTCADGLACVQDIGSPTLTTTGECVPPDGRVANEICRLDDECVDGLVCHRTRCLAPAGNGCVEDRDCITQRCVDERCHECEGLDEGCDEGEVCVDGLCGPAP